MNQVAERLALQPEFLAGNAPVARVRRSERPDLPERIERPERTERVERLERVERRITECGELPFLIRRDGSWLYQGSPIRRKEMVCLFSSVLKRREDGRYMLETPCERGLIAVEDAPFVAVELSWTGCGRGQTLAFRTNVDELVTADRDHPIRVAHDLLTCDPTPYLRVRPGLGRLPVEARIARSVYYELVALAEPFLWQGRECLGVWSRGSFFPLGDMPPADAADC